MRLRTALQAIFRLIEREEDLGTISSLGGMKLLFAISQRCHDAFANAALPHTEKPVAKRLYHDVLNYDPEAELGAFKARK